MRVLLLLSTVILSVLSVNSLSESEQWTNFKKTHGKIYLNKVEENLRFQVFKDNLNKIKNHNEKYAKGESSYYMGVNKFTDMTTEEFSNMLRNQISSKPDIKAPYKTFPEDLVVPTAIDWRNLGAVLKVKDQGNCGSCWSFSTTGAVEGQNAIVNNVSISLSEQQLMDCSLLYGNHGCYGGNMLFGFDYIQDYGIQSESSYPYVATSDLGNCKYQKNETVVKIKTRLRVNQTEDALKNAVGSVGPIAISMYATPLQHYEGGIFADETCENSIYYLNHGVLAVGYGVESAQDFWIIKNSWGGQWGEKGFFRLRRNPSLCGVLLDSSYPVLN